MRVAIFLDGKNFYSGWRDETESRKIDFGRLSRWVTRRARGESLFGVFYYTGFDVGDGGDTEGASSLRGFLDMLEHQPGYFVKRFPRKTYRSKCSSCGAAVSAVLTLDLATAPACTYCGGPVSTGEEIMRMREETLDAIRGPVRHSKLFSIGIFLILVLVFWPAALFYAMWKGGVLDPMMEKLGLATHERH